MLLGKAKWGSHVPKQAEDPSPQDHTGCKCHKTKCCKPHGIQWKMNASSASLLISTLNSYTGVRSRLRKLQMVAQWVLCSQGRKTFGGPLPIWWMINYLVYFPANWNNYRPIMLMCFLPRFLLWHFCHSIPFNFTIFLHGQKVAHI